MYAPWGGLLTFVVALTTSGATHLDGVVAWEGFDGLAGDVGRKAACRRLLLVFTTPPPLIADVESGLHAGATVNTKHPTPLS